MSQGFGITLEVFWHSFFLLIIVFIYETLVYNLFDTSQNKHLCCFLFILYIKLLYYSGLILMCSCIAVFDITFELDFNEAVHMILVVIFP